MEHTLKIFGGTDEARVTLGLPLSCRIGFTLCNCAYAARALCTCPLPGLKSFETFKTFLKLLERYWYNVQLLVEHILDGKKDSQFHNSK